MLTKLRNGLLKNDVLRFIIAYKVDKLMCNLSKGIADANQAIGSLKTLIQLVQDGDLSLNRAAEKAGMTTEEFLKKKEEYEKN